MKKTGKPVVKTKTIKGKKAKVEKSGNTKQVPATEPIKPE